MIAMKSAIETIEGRVLGGVQQSLLKYGRFQGSLDRLVSDHQSTRALILQQSQTRMQFVASFDSFFADCL